MNKNEDDTVMHYNITVMRLQMTTKRQEKGREKDKPGVSRLSSYRHYEMR